MLKISVKLSFASHQDRYPIGGVFYLDLNHIEQLTIFMIASRQPASNQSKKMIKISTNRNFQNYLYELDPNDKKINLLLACKPYATILIIGCGEGNALKQLRETYPQSTLYGIDLKPPKNATGFQFIQHDIQKPLPKELVGQCDFVFSVAVFPYVADKKAGLIHAHSALKQDGYGYISCEAFYFGPQAPIFFDNFAKHKAPPFAWEKKDYHTILMRGTPFKPETLMTGFKKFKIPPALRLYYYPDPKDANKGVITPGYYPKSIREKLYEQNYQRKLPEGKLSASYSHCPFLKVVEINEQGPDGAGDKNHRGYRHAADTVYLKANHLSVRAIIEILSSKLSYHQALLKPKWQEAKDQAYQDYLAERKEYLPDLNNETLNEVAQYLSGPDAKAAPNPAEIKSLLSDTHQKTSWFNHSCNLFTVATVGIAVAAAGVAYYASLTP